MQGPEVLIPIIMFGGGAVVAYKYFDGRHKERMAMIEKGTNPADLKNLLPNKSWSLSPLSNLKWGLMAIFVGAAIIFANFMHETYRISESVFPASILIAGGLALVIFYTIANAKIKKDEGAS
jgi:hypothetical protein